MAYLEGWYSNLTTVSQKLSQNKDLMKDKNKATLINDLGDSVKEMKSWIDKQKALGTKINDVKKARIEIEKAQAEQKKKEATLQSDVDNFFIGVKSYFNDADKLADKLKKVSPDTPKKEFTIAANNLGGLKVDTMKSETAVPPS